MEILGLNLRTIIVFLLNIVGIALIVFIVVGFLDVLTGSDEEDFRARRNMNILADRIEAVYEQELEGAEASVVIDMPPDYWLIVNNLDGQPIPNMPEYPRECRGDEGVCVCVLDMEKFNDDPTNPSSIIDCRKPKDVEELKMQFFEQILISTGPRLIDLNPDSNGVITITDQEFLDCSGNDWSDANDGSNEQMVLRYCHGKVVVRGRDVGFTALNQQGNNYFGKRPNEANTHEHVCYACVVETKGVLWWQKDVCKYDDNREKLQTDTKKCVYVD